MFEPLNEGRCSALQRVGDSCFGYMAQQLEYAAANKFWYQDGHLYRLDTRTLNSSVAEHRVLQ